jgi:hypothetical protein
MFDEKRSKQRIAADLKNLVDEVEEDIDVLATKELMKELEELEEMINMSE